MQLGRQDVGASTASSVGYIGNGHNLSEYSFDWRPGRPVPRLAEYICLMKSGFLHVAQRAR